MLRFNNGPGSEHAAKGRDLHGDPGFGKPAWVAFTPRHGARRPCGCRAGSRRCRPRRLRVRHVRVGSVAMPDIARAAVHATFDDRHCVARLGGPSQWDMRRRQCWVFPPPDARLRSESQGCQPDGFRAPAKSPQDLKLPRRVPGQSPSLGRPALGGAGRGVAVGEQHALGERGAFVGRQVQLRRDRVGQHE